MSIKLIFGILILFVIIRTIAYGIYCVKKTGVLGGISVFALSLGSIFAGWIILFGNRG